MSLPIEIPRDEIARFCRRCCIRRLSGQLRKIPSEA